MLTEEGVLHAEKLLGGIELYDPANMDTLHAVQQATNCRLVFYDHDCSLMMHRSTSRH